MVWSSSGSDGAYPTVPGSSPSRPRRSSAPRSRTTTSARPWRALDFDGDGYADLAVGRPGRGPHRRPRRRGGRHDPLRHGEGLSGSQLEADRRAERQAPVRRLRRRARHRRPGRRRLPRPRGRCGRRPGRPLVTDDNPPSGTQILFGGKGGITTTGTELLQRRPRRRPAGPPLRVGARLADVDADGRLGPGRRLRGCERRGRRAPGARWYCPAPRGPGGVPSAPPRRRPAAAGPVVVGNVQGDARPEIVVGVPSTDADTDPGSLQVVRLAGSGSATTGAARALRPGRRRVARDRGFG